MIMHSGIVQRFAAALGLSKTPMRKRLLTSLVIVGAASAALGGAALATPSSGIVSSMVWARAAFVDPVDIKFKVQGEHQTDSGNNKSKSQGGRQEVIRVPDAQDTVIQQIVIGPGGYTGWHSHPGPAVVLIKAGELTLYSSDDPTCTGRTYTAGQAFVDSGQGHVHIARNLGSNNTELWVTYFDVPPGQPFRLDAPNPGTCGF